VEVSWSFELELKMLGKSVLHASALFLQFAVAAVAHAQLLDDLEIKREENKTILLVKFSTPIQYQNAVIAKSGDFAQIVYSVTPTNDKKEFIFSERRMPANGNVPELTVTDKSMAGFEDRREVLLRFSKPIRFQVNVGRENKIIEIVLDESPADLTTQTIAVTPSTSNSTVDVQTTLTNTSNTQVDANAADLLGKAIAAYEQGNYLGSLESLNLILNLPINSSSRKSQELAGRARLQLGDRMRARSELELFLKLYPTGEDSDQVKQLLANLPITATESPKSKKTVVEPTSSTTGSLSVFYYGGQSKVRSVDFENSPISGLPVLLSDKTLAATDQKQIQTNLDLNWRYRDSEKDMRIVFRDTYNSDLMPNKPNINRLSALYFEQRSMLNGTNFRIGRQSPNGGGVLYRFDGVQAGYSFAPKWKVNGVAGVPTDALLDTKRKFYGFSVDAEAEAFSKELSGNVYLVQQMIDNEIDRRALGTEMRYFNGGVSISGQIDYDQKLKGLNIVSMQGTWQLPSNTVYNALLDNRTAPIRSLGNVLFFQDPSLLLPARRISDLLGTRTLSELRDQVNSITAMQKQAMFGFTTPLTSTWQTGANINYTNVGEIKPVAVILPNGQASTGDLWSLGAQMIGTNLYSTRDTHVLNVSFLSGPTYKGTLLSYNNLSGLSENVQLESAIRHYGQSETSGIKTTRITPSLRMTYRVIQQLSLVSEVAYEIARRNGPLVTEKSARTTYYIGGRYDF
jgi:tetratricopeptide (TPR) repeat protein